MPTVHVPHVLELYRSLAPDVPFFVVGDEQTPDDEVRRFLRPLGPAEYYSVEDQRRLGYESCELISWRHPGRRSIGYLEAVRAGAHIIVSADDDNYALNESYFRDFEAVVGRRFDGLLATSKRGWVDAASFLDPPVHHRGFPHQLWHPFEEPIIETVVNARVGVAAGLWLGDPDIDAVTRMVSRPIVPGVSPVADAGFVVDPACYSPFNSQNTAFVRDLLPVLLMLTPYGRFDDIWCSYVAERVMREHGWSVRFGGPFVWQQRNDDHQLIRDLAVEFQGMDLTLDFTAQLDDSSLKGQSVLDDATTLFERFVDTQFAPLSELGLAWVRDAERALA